MQNKIIKNTKYIMKQYKDHIKNDKQLVLLYWMYIDKLEMNKSTISTQDYLNKSTNPADIVNAKIMLELMSHA